MGVGLLGLLYRLLLEQLTFFHWNRVYLVIGMILCVVLPLFGFRSDLVESKNFSLLDDPHYKTFALGNENRLLGSKATEGLWDNTEWVDFATGALFWVYWIGCVYQLIVLFKTVGALISLRAKSKRISKEDGVAVFEQDRFPTFSFGNSIYLNKEIFLLSPTEKELVMIHECAHVKQKHSVDVIFYEIVNAVFWFNPITYYLSRSLKKIHEYLADLAVTNIINDKVEYGRLLVTLSVSKSASPLVHTFSTTQLYSRIKMLTKPKSNSMQKFRFLWGLPVVAIIVVVCSCFGTNSDLPSGLAVKAVKGETLKDNGLRIGKISWEGNTKFTDKELTSILGVKTGEVYDSARIDNSLYANAIHGEKDIVGLYMNNGYLFFRVEPSTKINGNIVDISLKIFEGQTAKIGKVTFVGIKKTNAVELIEKIEVKPGELFSRLKLINSQRILADLGKFDPKNIQVNPIPDWSSKTDGLADRVNIEFVVKEI